MTVENIPSGNILPLGILIMNNKNDLNYWTDFMVNISCGMSVAKPYMREDVVQYMRNAYRAIVANKQMPSNEDQSKLNKIVDYINDKVDYSHQLEDIYQAILPQLQKGKNQGSFACPFCGQKAWFKLQEGKEALIKCSNGCFQSKELDKKVS